MHASQSNSLNPERKTTTADHQLKQLSFNCTYKLNPRVTKLDTDNDKFSIKGLPQNNTSYCYADLVAWLLLSIRMIMLYGWYL